MAVLATRIWPSWRQPKGSRLGSTRGPNWAPISGGGVLPEIEPRFPAPCRGNRGPISGETAGQAALLKTLGRHRAARTMCVSARGVNITWHRPCVQMQGPGGAAKNVRSTSRGADHVCKCKGCQHHVASTMCANARDVNIA